MYRHGTLEVIVYSHQLFWGPLCKEWNICRKSPWTQSMMNKVKGEIPVSYKSIPESIW